MRASAHRTSAIPSSERAWLVAILSFAAVTRVIYLLLYRANDPLSSYLLHDAKRYHEWASTLAEGKAWEAGAFYQAPLYPYLVSLVYRAIGPEPLVIYLLQLLSGLVLLVLVHRIAKRIFGPGAALLASLLGAVHLPLVFYETKLLPVSLSVLLAAITIERVQAAESSRGYRAWIVPGLALGAGALTNPGFLVFAVLLGSWIVLDRSRGGPGRFSKLVVVVASAAAVILPVTVRNLAVTGEPVMISTNGGITFYQGNNPAARGVFSTPDGFSGSIFKQRQESRRLAEAESGRALDDSQVSRFWMRKGLGYWAEHPGASLVLEGRKLLLLAGNREQPLEYNVHLDPNPLRFLFVVPFAILLALAAARPFARQDRVRAEIPVWLLLLSQGVVLLVFYVSGRYRLPAVVGLLVLGGAGAFEIGKRARQGLRLAIGPIVASVSVAVFSLLAPSIAVPGLASRQDAVSLCDRGEAYFKSRSLERAKELYRRATELDPSYAFAHLDLGKVLFAAGDRAGAERETREALRLAPQSAEAHYDLGVVLYEQDRLDEAAESFAAVVRIDPGNADAANNLLGILLKLHRDTQAIRIWQTMKERNLAVDRQLDARVRGLGDTRGSTP